LHVGCQLWRNELQVNLILAYSIMSCVFVSPDNRRFRSHMLRIVLSK